MCGLTGIISRSANAGMEAQVQAALQTIAHRGPDGQASWSRPGGGLVMGHCRLSVIDLSERAAQPFFYLQRYTLLFNGEIYNYKELRQELELRGLPFTTHSDTEVLAAAWHAWGTESLSHFDGAFAFALWDEETQTFFAARDRFGEKPFFFSFEEGTLRFASEQKALWELGLKKEVNRALLYNFLTIGYTTNPGDPMETFYEGIYKLPAANLLRWAPGMQEPELERYWQLSVDEEMDISDEEAIERFRQLFYSSVDRRLRSDVPVGTSLSGGLDSASVVAACHASSNKSYTHKCFTAVFPGFEKDESARAAMLASRFGLQQVPVVLDGKGIPELMLRTMRHQEEPIGSASALAQFAVFEASKKNGIKVLLDGQGADEILAGYGQYHAWHWRNLYAKRLLAKSGELKAAKILGRDTRFSWKDKAAALAPELTAALWQSRKIRMAAATPGLHPEFVKGNRDRSYYAMPAISTLNGILHHHTVVQGLEELLRYADRNSSAHGVEVRLPFLSRELVEFLFTLPPSFKIREGHTKWLLRKAMEPALPAEVVWNTGKIGFEPPQKEWMQMPDVISAIHQGKERLVKENVLAPSVLHKKPTPHTAYAALPLDWRAWSASFLF